MSETGIIEVERFKDKDIITIDLERLCDVTSGEGKLKLTLDKENIKEVSISGDGELRIKGDNKFVNISAEKEESFILIKFLKEK